MEQLFKFDLHAISGKKGNRVGYDARNLEGGVHFDVAMNSLNDIVDGHYPIVMGETLGTPIKNEVDAENLITATMSITKRINDEGRIEFFIDRVQGVHLDDAMSIISEGARFITAHKNRTLFSIAIQEALYNDNFVTLMKNVVGLTMNSIFKDDFETLGLTENGEPVNKNTEPAEKKVGFDKIS